MRTSWRRRRGCVTTPTRASATASRRCRSRAATSCARPATRTSSSRDLEAAFDRLRAKHGSDEYRAVEAEEIMARKNFAATGSFIPEDRSRALDLLGFSSQLVFNTFHNRRLHDWEHPGTSSSRSAPPAPTTAAWSSSAPSTRAAAHLLRAARRLRRAPRRWPTRRSRWARPRCSSRRAARPATRRATSALDPVWAQRAGGRHPDRVPRRRHRRPDRPELLQQRAADPARLPRRRGELPLGRLHGDPRPARADARHDDLRRRARAVPGRCASA